MTIVKTGLFFFFFFLASALSHSLSYLNYVRDDINPLEMTSLPLVIFNIVLYILGWETRNNLPSRAEIY